MILTVFNCTDLQKIFNKGGGGANQPTPVRHFDASAPLEKIAKKIILIWMILGYLMTYRLAGMLYNV